MTVSTTNGTNIRSVVLTIGRFANNADYVTSTHGTCSKPGNQGNGTTYVTVTDINASSVTFGVSAYHLQVSQVVVSLASTSSDVSNTGNDYTFTMPGYDVEVSTAVYPYVEKPVSAGSWVAISAPVFNCVGTEAVDFVNYLTNASYDLLGYDEEHAQWLNAKNVGGAAGFTALTKGHGYIYRRNSTETLRFNGDYNTENVTLTDLSYLGPGDLKGWHLVGNPYNETVTTDAVYYSLSADGTWVKHDGGTLAIGEAVLIHVSSGTNSVAFNYSAGTMTITGGGAKGVPVPKGLNLTPDPSPTVEGSSYFALCDGNRLLKRL